MTYLLDVNTLIAAIWKDHTAHARADAWLVGKTVAVCPITELGFLRISSHPKALNIAMVDARRALKQFIDDLSVTVIPADLSALKSVAQKSDHVTDQYLANLAAHHKMRLATLDAGIKHTAAVLIS